MLQTTGRSVSGSLASLVLFQTAGTTEMCEVGAKEASALYICGGVVWSAFRVLAFVPPSRSPQILDLY